MDQNREERMQQRLRGAQRRNIKEVDFGFSIPAAAIPASATSPPPPVADEQTDPRTRTPPLPTLPPAASESARPSTAQGAFDANTSAKRRKLDSDPPILSSGGRSTRSSRSIRPDIYTLVDDEEQPIPEASPVVGVPTPTASGSGRISETQSSVARNISESQATPSVHFAEETTIISIDGRIGSESIHNARNDDTVSRLEIDETESPTQLSEIETPIPARKRKRLMKRARNSIADELDELSPDQPYKRNRPSPVADSHDHSDPLSDPVEPEEAEAINDSQAAQLLSRNKGKRKFLDPVPPPSLVQDIETATLPKQRRQRRSQRDVSNRSEQRQPKKKQNKAQSSRKRAEKSKIRSGSPIPVTVHRLTEALVYDEDEEDADILNAEIPYSKQAGVNSIDVLRQVCQEMLTTALDTLQDGRQRVDDAALRREYLTKWRAVDAFADEIYARLLEHTISLDNCHALERRVKAESKRKLHLREEILRVRAERETVALRMDEVRILHENESARAAEVVSMNTSFHDIELAVEKGRDGSSKQASGEGLDLNTVEMQLQKVAGLASSKGAGGGLLNQIKEFNSFLERAAFALETRRA